jgi:Raf kinase inhibitor-like YbhB/YbcL family protein
MKSLTIAAAIVALAAIPAFAQAPAAPSRPNALVEFPAKGSAKLTVTTPAWTDGGDIPFENTQYRSNTFPGLAWTAGPSGTRSYAVIMQDTGGSRNGAPILHWTLYNIPVSVTKLDAAMAATGNPPGSSYGPGLRGAAQPYNGPRTPAGPKHPYHLQVFALDNTLKADPALDYDGLTGQMKGHILADGEVVGMGSVDPNAPPPPPRPAQ